MREQLKCLFQQMHFIADISSEEEAIEEEEGSLNCSHCLLISYCVICICVLLYLSCFAARHHCIPPLQVQEYQIKFNLKQPNLISATVIHITG